MGKIPTNFGEFSAEEIINSLTYISYATQRQLAPDIPVERWAKLYSNAEAYEEIYQKQLKEQLEEEREQ